MEQLFVFVEGNDDERFFSYYYRGINNIRIIKYSQMTQKDVRNFLNTIRRKDGWDYIFVADSDGSSMSERKSKISQRYTDCEQEKIVVVVFEIESWYLAGLNEIRTTSYKMKYHSKTNNISKETFIHMLPKEFDRISFQIEILKYYDNLLAVDRNDSFRAFYCEKRK